MITGPRKILLLLCIAVFSTSCSNRYLQGTAQNVAISESSHELYDESVDLACAYFYYLWGKSAQHDERYEEAREAYEKSLVCDTKAEFVMHNLIVLLVKMGKREQALTLMEKLAVDNPHDIKTLSLLANLYAAMGKTDKAVETYKILIEKDKEPQYLLMLGTLYGRNHQYEEAEKIFLDLLKLDDQSYMGYYYLARLYRENGSFEKARAMYEKCLDLNWSTPLAFEIAEFFMQEKKDDDAISIFNKILENEDTDERARGELAGLYLRMEQPEKALEELQKLREYASDRQKVDLSIGRIYLEQERFNEAVEIYSRLLEESSEPENIRPLLAAAFYKLGDKQSAKDHLSKVHSSSKGYEESMLMLVQMLQEEDKFDEAIKLLSDCIADQEKRKKSFYRRLADLYKKSDQIEKGKAVFEEAMAEYPSDTRILFEYGMFLDELGDSAAATERMQQILAINPQDAYALNYVGYIWAEKGIHLPKALEYIQQAVALRPEDGYIRDSLGWVYFKQGEYQRAVEELEKALSIETDDPTINEHAGDAYLKIGDKEKALGAYEKSYELYSDEEKKQKVKDKLDNFTK